MTRPMIEHIRNTNSKINLIGVEKGVYYWNNALNILKILPLEWLYLINPYESYIESRIFWRSEIIFIRKWRRNFCNIKEKWSLLDENP